ncbi:MAG TPA: hypothetical protein PLE54_07060 [Burkholderiaceae bacterium]|nr:hypothetical protein [Burkholderiaceae bacterium]
MRNTKLNRDLEGAIKQWVSDSGVTFDYAVTLTSPDTYRDRQDASRKVRYFLNRLNRELLRHRYKRLGECVAIFPTIESKNRKMHVHAAIRCPVGISVGAFKSAIRECWKAAHEGVDFAIVDIRPMHSIDWIGYICKETAIGNIDAIDIANISWGNRSTANIAANA